MKRFVNLLLIKEILKSLFSSFAYWVSSHRLFVWLRWPSVQWINNGGDFLTRCSLRCNLGYLQLLFTASRHLRLPLLHVCSTIETGLATDLWDEEIPYVSDNCIGYRSSFFFVLEVSNMYWHTCFMFRTHIWGRYG